MSESEPSPNVIACRTFQITFADGRQTTIEVDILRPEAIDDSDAEHSDWQCAVRTRGFAGNRCRQVMGADSLQALTFAVRLARTLVHNFCRSHAVVTDWDDVPDRGFFPELPAA